MLVLLYLYYICTLQNQHKIINKKQVEVFRFYLHSHELVCFSWGKSTEFGRPVSLICNVCYDDPHQSRTDNALFCTSIILYLLTCFSFYFMRSFNQGLDPIHFCITTSYCLAVFIYTLIHSIKCQSIFIQCLLYIKQY